ncbi:MAG: GAF domain-containing protein [Anaerolineae bacterium]|nr:GAF domain-containing protein [Anaerolineae bacterium]
MNLRTRTLLLIIPLLTISVLSISIAITISGRQAILQQSRVNGEILTEQFAHTVKLGEEIRQGFEVIIQSQQAAQIVLAPLIQNLAQTSGRSRAEIAEQLEKITGQAEFEAFVQQYVVEGVWIEQFTKQLLGENVIAIWVVDLELKTTAHNAIAPAEVDREVIAEDRALLQAALTQDNTQNRLQGPLLKVATPVKDTQGRQIGAVLVYFPMQHVQTALDQQLQLTALIALLVLTIGVLTSIFMAENLTRPLMGLVNAAQMVQDEQFTLEQAKDLQQTKGNYEINQLRRIFGQMAQEVILRYQEAQQRNAELQTVYEIAQDITANSITPNKTLQTILARVEQIIPYDGGEICLYVPENNGLLVRAWKGHPGFDSRGRIYKLGEGFTGGIAQQQRSLLVPDIEQHPTIKAVHTQLGKSSFVRSFVGVPLLVGERLVGTLELVSQEPGAFDEHVQRLLEIISPQAAIAIDNAQQVELRERKLKQQIAQLRIEIDEAKKSQQVAQITESEYFQTLHKRAKELREQKSQTTDETVEQAPEGF